jgi:hypothetical protein
MSPEAPREKSAAGDLVRDAHGPTFALLLTRGLLSLLHLGLPLIHIGAEDVQLRCG